MLLSSWTIFRGYLNAACWGKGCCARYPVEENIVKISYWEIQDVSSVSNLPNLLPLTLYDLATLVIDAVCTNTSRASSKISERMAQNLPLFHAIRASQCQSLQSAIHSKPHIVHRCDRALRYFHVQDADGRDRPLIDLVEYAEVYNCQCHNLFIYRVLYLISTKQPIRWNIFGE